MAVRAKEGWKIAPKDWDIPLISRHKAASQPFPLLRSRWVLEGSQRGADTRGP